MKSGKQTRKCLGVSSLGRGKRECKGLQVGMCLADQEAGVTGGGSKANGELGGQVRQGAAGKPGLGTGRGEAGFCGL